MAKPKIQINAIAAMTLDGRIAQNDHQHVDWSSREDKLFLRRFLKECDLLFVGRHTYETSAKVLKKYPCAVITKAKKLPGRMVVQPSRKKVLALIKKTQAKKIAVIGGAQTYSFFLNNNLLDNFYLTIEPIAFGHGISLFAQINKLKRRFRLQSARRLNRQGTLLLHYQFL